MKTGLPIELVKYLRDKLNIKTFIETGTGMGVTAEIAGEIFERVYTIEADMGRWEYNKEKPENETIIYVLGKSPRALESLLCNSKDKHIVIFLDAHCSYREQVTDVACPVLQEIATIPSQHIVIIDDVHSFIYPHKVKSIRDVWPEITDVIIGLYKRDDPYVFIVGKSLVAVPRFLKNDVMEFLSNEN